MRDEGYEESGLISFSSVEGGEEEEEGNLPIFMFVLMCFQNWAAGL